jgi:hypothetical protein
MGEYNSSVTRVWPIFDFLFHHDPTGASWLGSLLTLGSRAAQIDQQIRFNPGRLLPELARFTRAIPSPVKKALGKLRATKIGQIRDAYEADIPPSVAFLRWLLEHPNQLKSSKAGKRLSQSTPESASEKDNKRIRLMSGETRVLEEALKQLATVGAAGSCGKWWAFEGFTSVDCRFETESLVLLIEGKRTEAVSDSTDWCPGRNQVIRNLEAAQVLAGSRKTLRF